MSKVIEGLRYSEDHEWVKVEGDIAIIGITDYAQKELGDITYADLPEADDEAEAGDEFGALGRREGFQRASLPCLRQSRRGQP